MMKPANDQNFYDYVRYFNVIAQFERWHRIGTTARALSKLSNEQLADIGVSRDGIEEAANDAFAARSNGGMARA